MKQNNKFEGVNELCEDDHWNSNYLNITHKCLSRNISCMSCATIEIMYWLD